MSPPRRLRIDLHIAALDEILHRIVDQIDLALDFKDFLSFLHPSTLFVENNNNLFARRKPSIPRRNDNVNNPKQPKSDYRSQNVADKTIGNLNGKHSGISLLIYEYITNYKEKNINFC